MGHCVAEVRRLEPQGRIPRNPAVGKSSAGLPVRMQLVGRFFDDPLVMKTAYAYQQSTDWEKIIGVHS